MQLKTIQQIVEEKVPSGTEHGWWLDDYTDDLLTQDRADIRAVLREVISNQLAFELDENGDALLRKHDILTLIDTLLPGDVSK